MPKSKLFTKTKYFWPFPEPSDVFDTNVDQHRNFLLPLATLYLAYINSEWSGLIHFVTPSFQTEYRWSGRYQTHLCRERWLGFRMKNNKIELECDFRYLKTPKTTDEQKWQRMANEGFALRKQHFQEHKCLHHRYAKKRKGQYNETDLSLIHI